MKRLYVAAFALFAALFVFAPAHAGSINGMQQSAVCDPTTNQGLNCAKPTPAGAIPAAPSQLDSSNLSGTISVTNTFQSIQSANSNRSGCLIQNQSTTDTMWVFFGPVASATKAASFMLDATHGLQISCSVGGTSVLRDQVSITGTATDAYVANFQ